MSLVLGSTGLLFVDAVESNMITSSHNTHHPQWPIACEAKNEGEVMRPNLGRHAIVCMGDLASWWQATVLPPH